MYEEHETFIQPENGEIKVWQYMDFTKLVSLLDSRRLYFTRADELEDPFEGSWPRINVAARQFVGEDIPPKGREKFLEQMCRLGDINKHWPRYIAINCWHMNEYESAAMWRLYLKSDEGIAIQSTYTKLRKSLIDTEKIFLGRIEYIDYDSEHIDARNILGAFVHKRKSFRHEQEVRALVLKMPTGEGGVDFTLETIDHGLQIKVDIETLIERIYVAPSAPAWLADLVKAVITRYGYNFEVVHSKLDQNPVF